MTKTCPEKDCERTFEAEGPKARKTLRYNLRMHRQAVHKAATTHTSDTEQGGN